MVEAQKLGDRISIMVEGDMMCLGTAQHLLAKYSSGYTIAVSMCEGYDVEDEILPAILELCPQAAIKEHPGPMFASVDLGRSEFSVANMYDILQRYKQGGLVDYFSVGQANLESVFLRFAGEAAKSGDD